MATQNSRREVLEKAYDEAAAEPEEIEVEEVAETEVEDVTEEVAEVEEVEEEVSEADEEPVSDEVEEEAEEVTEREYPSSWKKDEALTSAFNKIPEEVYSEIQRREADFHKGIEGFREKASYADKMQQAIQPYMATINSLGVAPEQAITSLLGADHKLRYGQPFEKKQALQSIAQQYGVDLEGIQEPVKVDPQYQALQTQLQQLQQSVEQQKQQESQSLNSEIESFAQEHSDFEAVREDMAVLLQEGRASSLQDAYDKALWLNPETRSNLLSQQQKEAEAKRKAAAKQAAAKAKKASASVSTQGGSVASQAKPKSLRAALEAAYDDKI